MHFASASPLSGSASPRETPSRFGRNRPESIYADPERKRVGKPVLLYALDGKENGLSSPFNVVCGVPTWMQTGRKTRSPLPSVRECILRLPLSSAPSRETLPRFALNRPES